jgi:hypothetical protein
MNCNAKLKSHATLWGIQIMYVKIEVFWCGFLFCYEDSRCGCHLHQNEIGTILVCTSLQLLVAPHMSSSCRFFFQVGWTYCSPFLKRKILFGWACLGRFLYLRTPLTTIVALSLIPSLIVAIALDQV